MALDFWKRQEERSRRQLERDLERAKERDDDDETKEEKAERKAEEKDQKDAERAAKRAETEQERAERARERELRAQERGIDREARIKKRELKDAPMAEATEEVDALERAIVEEPRGRTPRTPRTPGTGRTPRTPRTPRSTDDVQRERSSASRAVSAMDLPGGDAIERAIDEGEAPRARSSAPRSTSYSAPRTSGGGSRSSGGGRSSGSGGYSGGGSSSKPSSEPSEGGGSMEAVEDYLGFDPLKNEEQRQWFEDAIARNLIPEELLEGLPLAEILAAEEEEFVPLDEWRKTQPLAVRKALTEWGKAYNAGEPRGPVMQEIERKYGPEVASAVRERAVLEYPGLAPKPTPTPEPAPAPTAQAAPASAGPQAAVDPQALAEAQSHLANAARRLEEGAPGSLEEVFEGIERDYGPEVVKALKGEQAPAPAATPQPSPSPEPSDEREYLLGDPYARFSEPDPILKGIGTGLRHYTNVVGKVSDAFPEHLNVKDEIDPSLYPEPRRATAPGHPVTNDLTPDEEEEIEDAIERNLVRGMR